jgi:hypothetical protein
MRKLGLLILCGACWLAGYYFGRRPDSPDIFGWISMQVQNLSARDSRDRADAPDAARPEGADRRQESRQGIEDHGSSR